MTAERLDPDSGGQLVPCRLCSLGGEHLLDHGGVMERYVIRPGATGFSIMDIWTGEPAVVAAAPQVGLSQSDADHIAQLLNQRASDAPSQLSSPAR